MYPYIEVFGMQISMMTIGSVIAVIIFLVTAWILAKRNHQDFLKLFYRLPGWIIFSYLLGRYVAFALETGIYLPTSMQVFLQMISPQNFDFHFVGLLLASRICLAIFFSSIKRTENKKIRADIIFLSMANALIIFGIFITLGDSIIGKPTDSMFAIRALTDNSALTKFDGVYPVGLFISFGVLIVHVLVSLLSIILKKNGLGMRGLIGILVVFNIVFLFQAYPRYGLISIFGESFDIKQYISLFIIILGIITSIRWGKKRF